MRAETLDAVRRTLRTELHERIQAADLEPTLAERIGDDLGELLDALLMTYESASLGRHVESAAGAFLFTDCWPKILRHVLPWAALARGCDARTADRLRAPRPVGLVGSD